MANEVVTRSGIGEALAQAGRMADAIEQRVGVVIRGKESLYEIRRDTRTTRIDGPKVGDEKITGRIYEMVPDRVYLVMEKPQNTSWSNPNNFDSSGIRRRGPGRVHARSHNTAKSLTLS